MSILCIFDLDGTLLDTLGGIHYHLGVALNSHQFPCPTREQTRTLVGHGLKNLVRDSLSAFDQDSENSELVQSILQKLLESYRQDPPRQTRPYPGIPEVLHSLAARGCSLAVLTNKDQDLAQRLVHHFFPNLFFSVIGSGPAWPRKPAPDSSTHLRTSSGARGSLFIGDSEVDIRTAKAAGIPAAGVTWGFRDRPILEREAPDWLVDRPGDLVGIVLGLAEALESP